MDTSISQIDEYNGKRCIYCGVKLKYLTVCDMCARRQKIIEETAQEIRDQVDDEYECGEDGEVPY